MSTLKMGEELAQLSVPKFSPAASERLDAESSLRVKSLNPRYAQ